VPGCTRRWSQCATNAGGNRRLIDRHCYRLRRTTNTKRKWDCRTRRCSHNLGRICIDTLDRRQQLLPSCVHELVLCIEPLPVSLIAETGHIVRLEQMTPMTAISGDRVKTPMNGFCGGS